MKSTIDSVENEHEGRRGIFRRGRRGAGAPTSTGTATSGEHDTSQIDEIARRMSALSGDASDAAGSIAGQLDLQRAAIARANRTASTPEPAPSTEPAPVAAPTASPEHEPSNAASEESMPIVATQPETTAPITSPEDDIQARMEAVLAPAPAAKPAPVTLPTFATQSTPVAEPAPMQAQPLAPIATPTPTAPIARPALPLTSSASAAPTAATLLGIDVDRMIAILEEEARSAQQRIELEIRSAHAQAAEIVSRAEGESERIREHGQNQARVLLNEVEEIISEAQATGEQILLRANDEAGTLRNEATNVLHQAQNEARSIIETSRREGEQVLAEQRRLATVRAQEAMREQDRLKDQIRRLEERRRQVLESLEPLIAQLTQMMPTDAMPAPVAPANVVQLDRTRQS